MKTFITQDIQIISGETAEKLIKEKNDAKFFSDKKGIIKVDKNRWKEAQNYERNTWCISGGKNCVDDRNLYHKEKFNNYKDLSSLLKNNISVIELGCGPFTNLRLIIPLLYKSIKFIDLLDPLIKDYIMYSPNCVYKTGLLEFISVNTINSTIEEFNSTKKYDLTVMINVLEHCFDIDLIFEKVFNMMNDGGILLFADKVMNEHILHEWIENVYDAGHPIRISEEYINEKIKAFKVKYSYDDITSDYTVKYLILQK